MTRFASAFVPGSADAVAARERMLESLARVRTLEQRTRDASAAAGPRFAKRGQLLPRERLSVLLDAGAPFLEFSTLAGYRLDDPDPDKSVPGGGVVTGIAQVAGTRCVIAVSDSGIDAGALQPRGLDKQLRAQEIALQNRLPYVQLVESAGANLLNYRVEEFVHGGNLFRNLARLSAAGLPVVTVVHGSSTAGGAYQTGLSDYIVMVRGRSRAFLAGPPLLLAATGEKATEEELGGAEMHTGVSGLGHYLAEDDRDALRMARELVAKLGRGDTAAPYVPTALSVPAAPPPSHDPEELLGVMPADPRRPVDMREVIVRLVDASGFMEFAERFGAATVCANARLDGHPLGIITNNGPIDADGAAKAARFIESCCRARIPILYLQNTTGFLVGRAQEEAGIIRHGSALIRAITTATVPQVTVHCGASYGAGNYAMCGRGFHPNFCFSWPNARTAVMGAEQAARTMGTVLRARAGRSGAVDEEQVQRLERRIVDNFERQIDVFATSAHLLDDGVIDPRDTRAVLALALAVCREADVRHREGAPR
jgi:geranyl-CoA carboxylase beta subunit